MSPTKYQNLYEPFASEVEKTLSKGGARLTYIPVSEVITRLNKVLGIDAWSFNILSCERDAIDPDYIVAHVRLMWHVDGTRPDNAIVRDGFGGQKIKRTKAGDIVDLGDEMKGAVSDALKKAAQTLGVGLYLARSEEALEADIEPVPEVVISPEIEELWGNFVGLSKSLNANAKGDLNTFWKTHAGERPKPTKTTATKEDLVELINECVRLSFEGATVVSE
jgi:hypothetical protein